MGITSDNNIHIQLNVIFFYTQTIVQNLNTSFKCTSFKFCTNPLNMATHKRYTNQSTFKMKCFEMHIEAKQSSI